VFTERQMKHAYIYDTIINNINPIKKTKHYVNFLAKRFGIVCFGIRNIKAVLLSLWGYIKNTKKFGSPSKHIHSSITP